MQAKIKVSLREFGHAAGVGALESGDLEPVTAGPQEEGHLSLRSHRDWRRYPISPRSGAGLR
jgi:hypothetical protein